MCTLIFIAKIPVAISSRARASWGALPTPRPLTRTMPWTCWGPGSATDLLPHWKGDPSYGLDIESLSLNEQLKTTVPIRSPSEDL